MTTQLKERRNRAVAPAPQGREATLRSERPRIRAAYSLRTPNGQRRAGLGCTISTRARSSRPLPVVPKWKRSLDLACIIFTLPLAIPLIAFVALWIRLVSHGPALFRQQRIGLGGKRFTLYKFRSMRHGASTADHEAHVEKLVESDCPMIKLDLLGDSRLIPGGRFLRTAGLDELPQLFNVLRGEMSLVGPRPCITEEYEYFTSSQRERFTVLPGLTGLWQVNGKNLTTFREMNVMDVHYARKATPVLDLIIMLRTPMALLRQMSECLSDQEQGRSSVETGYPTDGRAVMGYRAQRITNRV